MSNKEELLEEISKDRLVLELQNKSSSPAILGKFLLDPKYKSVIDEYNFS